MKKQATMVYLMRNDEILFLVRKKDNDTTHQQGMYLPIGGKVEPNESVIEAATREVREESGVKVSNLQLYGVLHFISWGPDKHDWVNFLFVSKDFDGEPVAGNEGHFEWISKHDLNSIELYEGDKVFLPELLNNNFTVIEFIYNDFSLLKHKIITKLPL